MASKFKRIFAVIMAATLVFGITACGGGGKDPSKVKGETFDTGEFSVLVPDGWKLREVSFSGEVDPSSVQIFKGAKEELDYFTTPYIYVRSCANQDSVTDALTWAQAYDADSAEQLDAVTTGDFKWDAAKADTGNGSYGDMFILTANEPYKFRIDIASEKDGTKLSLEDADVQAILASLKETSK